MNKKTWAASALALAVTVSSGALIAGNVNAATASKTKTAAVAASADASANSAKEADNDAYEGHRGPGHHPFEAAVLADAEVAKLLGLTTTDLAAQLQSGKSLAAIAGEKNVAVQSVADLEVKAITSALDQQLKDGKITQAKYDSLKTNIATWATEIVNDTRIGIGGGKEWGRGHGARVDVLGDAALSSLLGMTADELKTAVQSGKSLATIAGEKKVTVQAVTDQIVKTFTTALDKQLADKQITQAKYDEEKAEIAARASDIVNGKFGGPGRGEGHGHRDHGPRD